MAKNSVQYITVVILTIVTMSGLSYAERLKSTEDFFEMSLAELMEMPVSVASMRESTQRQSPGIVTVITREEIQRSGARDFVDILRMVPGIDVMFDMQGAYGITIRGLWANEGKILVLLDGVPLNDSIYNNFQWGRHIPVSIIERIEIIRGPGSIIYGDSAELGVIKIETISAQKANDVMVSTTYSRMKEKVGREVTTVFYGTRKNDFSFSISTTCDQGNFTDQRSDYYSLGNGPGYDFGDHGYSEMRSHFTNFSLVWGNLSFKGIVDRNRVNSPWFDTDVMKTDLYKTSFDSDIFEVGYKVPIDENLLWKSKILYKHQKPWNWRSIFWGSGGVISDSYTADSSLSYNLEGGHNIIAGAEYNYLRGRDSGRDGTMDYEDIWYGSGEGKNKVNYYTSSFYGEGFVKTPHGHLTVGGRYAMHNRYDGKFVPRIAFVKTFDIYHIKALYTQAFRFPSMMNISQDSDIKPESTIAYDLEFGAQVTNNLQVTANVFDVQIKDPIIYNQEYGYRNFKKVGSQGIEAAVAYKKDNNLIKFIYSYYKATDNDVADYNVPGQDSIYLGVPAHKITLLASLNPYRKVFITPSLTYYSFRYGIIGQNGGSSIYKKYDAKILTNISLMFQDAFNREGLDLSFSIYNIMDERYDFIEPFNGGYGPMPGPSREYLFTLTYRF